MKFRYGFVSPAIAILAIAFPGLLILSESLLAAPQEIPRRNAFLAAEPQLEITPDGHVLVSVQTLESCTGGEAFLGIFPLQAPLPYPVYRFTGDLILIDPNHMTAQFSISDLENEKVDINDLKRQKGGQLAFRLHLFAKRLQVIERYFAYAKSDEGVYQQAPALAEGPFVDCVTDSSAAISWNFDQLTTCRLLLEPGGRVLHFSPNLNPHEITIAGLAPDTEYHYTIVWSDKRAELASPHHHFRTAPPPGIPAAGFRFAVFCDSRGTLGGENTYVEGVNQSTFEALLNQAHKESASFIVFPGDLISGPSSDPAQIALQFRSWKRMASPVGGNIPIYEGVGNHDLTAMWVPPPADGNYIPRTSEEAGEVIFARHFVNPRNGPAAISPAMPPYSETVYSFDWGTCHLVMLNSNYFEKGGGEGVADLPGEVQGSLRPEQLEWLEMDLQAARLRGQRRLFVFTHEPAFPTGGHAKDAMWYSGSRLEISASRDRFWQILCQNQVTAAFFGHEHNYTRMLIDAGVDSSFDFPIWQIVTGGGGAPFYNRDESVPWAAAIQAFYPLPHLCLVAVDANRISLTVLTPEGQVMETVVLGEN